MGETVSALAAGCCCPNGGFSYPERAARRFLQGFAGSLTPASTVYRRGGMFLNDDEVHEIEPVPADQVDRFFADPVRLGLIVGTAFVVTIAGLCGWLGYQSRAASKAEEFRQLLLQVGRQGAANLTTIDYEHADADVKRIVDSATGQFYDEFNSRSGPFVEMVKKAQSKSVGTVTEAGIESINGQEGQVLVAVTVKTTTRAVPEDSPRYWRMRLTVDKQGADAKVSKVEFVP